MIGNRVGPNTHTHGHTLRQAKWDGCRRRRRNKGGPRVLIEGNKKTQSIHFDNGTIRLIGHGDDIEKYFISIYS